MTELRAIPDELVKREELALMMRISVRTVDHLKKEGMPFVPWTGTMIRFRPREAMAWAEAYGQRKRRERERRAA